MRALGIDLGLKRIGFAMSDELGISIKMLPVRNASSRNELMKTIIEMCVENNIKEIVIGCPNELSAQSKAIAKRAKGLREEILKKENLAHIKASLWDESYTSKTAHKMLLEMSLKRTRRKELIDSASAAVILEEFLQARGHQDA